MSEKDLKKWSYGSFDYRTDYNTSAHLMQWFDNEFVVVVSSFPGVECTNIVQRYNLAQKKKIKIDCPDTVLQYNRSMGGVDLTDMLPFTEPISSQEKDGTSNPSSIVLI